MSSKSIGRGIVISNGSLNLKSISFYENPSLRASNSTHKKYAPESSSSSASAASGDSDDELVTTNGKEDNNVTPTPQDGTLDSESTSSTVGFEEPIKLTQSTYSFLFTEPVHSIPYAFAIGILVVSYTCLLLALVDNIYLVYTPENPLSVPVGVTTVVKVAQYLALSVGSIMEEEIPESLVLLSTRWIPDSNIKDSSYVQFSEYSWGISS